MTRRALQHGAINRSQGFPDFDTHTKLKVLRFCFAKREEILIAAAVTINRKNKI